VSFSELENDTLNQAELNEIKISHSLSRVVVPATLHNISVNAHFTRFLSNLETVNIMYLKLFLLL
jgi:hypothetical protein